MEKYFGKLIEDYEQILNNEFVDFKKRILGKLEGIINGETPQENFLDKLIDYNSMPKGRLGRIKNVLKLNEIETYKDLQREVYEYFSPCKRSWKDEKTYFSYLSHLRNLGDKSIDVLISHLKSINFDFSKESAKKAVEKTKSSC